VTTDTSEKGLESLIVESLIHQAGDLQLHYSKDETQLALDLGVFHRKGSASFSGTR
jgi:hypothetical protein